MVVDTVILSIAFSAGVATFFSPCSIALIPAYIGYFLGLDEEEEATRDVFGAAWAGARFGGSAAGGIIGFFALGGALIFLLRRQFDFSSALLGDTVTYLAIAVAVAIGGLGVLMLLDRGPSVNIPIKAPQEKTVASMAAFGVVFAIGSMGCTLPVFITVLVQAFSQGPLGAFATFLSYGSGLAVLMLGVGIGLAVAKEQVHHRIRQVLPYIKPVTGLVLIGAGAYMVYYYTVVIPA